MTDLLALPTIKFREHAEKVTNWYMKMYNEYNMLATGWYVFDEFGKYTGRKVSNSEFRDTRGCSSVVE